MSENKGYPLPSNLVPGNDRCFVVYVPDEPEYIAAFFGSYTHLGLWNVWEKTGDNSGAVAGKRWKEAILRTLQVESIVDCQFLEDLLEDGDMSVNITNNVSCGQCGGSGGCSCEPTITPDPIQIPPEVVTELPNLPTQNDDGINAPDGFDDRETYLAHKCRAARELARDIIQTLGNFATLSGVLGALGAYALGLLITAPASAFVASLLLPLISVGLSAAAAIAIVGAALMFLIAGGVGMMVYFNNLEASLATKIDELTCVLYTASSGAEARAGVIQFINEDVAELIFDDAGDKEVFSRAIESILGAILAPNIFKVLFATGVAVTEWLTERDDGFDCAECTPPTLGSWIWSYSSGYGGESTVTVTLNNATDFHANGNIWRDCQFCAFEFRLDHPIATAVNRMSFTFTKVEGDQLALRMSGQNVFSNMQSGTYLVAEEAQPDAGDFDFVSTRAIPDNARWQFSTPYNASSPRPFGWEFDDLSLETV